jgi:hypothetical protein
VKLKPGKKQKNRGLKFKNPKTEAPKMDFEAKKQNSGQEKWIFAQKRRIGGSENGFWNKSREKMAPKMDFKAKVGKILPLFRDFGTKIHEKSCVLEAMISQTSFEALIGKGFATKRRPH